MDQCNSAWRGHRTLRLALVVNLLLLVLYAWTATETTVVEVAVQGDHLVASINGFQLAVDDPNAHGEGIGLVLGGPEQRWTYDNAGPPVGSAVAWLGKLAARFREEPFGTAWGGVTLLDGDGRAVRELPVTGAGADWRDLGDGWRIRMLRAVAEGGAASAGENGASTGGVQYRLRATLRRAITPAGVLLRAQDSGDGLLLLVRPEFRGYQWWRLSNGKWSGPVAAGSWGQTAISLLQDDLRLLLITHQVALIVLLTLLSMGSVVALGARGVARLRGLGTGRAQSEGHPPHAGPGGGQAPGSGRDKCPQHWPRQMPALRTERVEGDDVRVEGGDAPSMEQTPSQSSCPRKRASTNPFARWMPAFAGMTGSGAFFRAMTARIHAKQRQRTLDSRVRGNDGGQGGQARGNDGGLGGQVAGSAGSVLLGGEQVGGEGRWLGVSPTALAVLLGIAVAGVAAYIALVLLEAMPHVQDDVTYLFQARVMAMGKLWVPASPIPEAFEQEFIVNFAGRAFGKYSPGHPLMLLPGVLAGVPWLVNPVQAGLTVFVIYRIGRLVYGAGSGLLAALLAATSPFLLFMSGSMMAHPTGLLFSSLFVWGFVKCTPDREDGHGEVGHVRSQKQESGMACSGKACLAATGDSGADAAVESSQLGQDALLRDPPKTTPLISVLTGAALGFVFLTRPWTGILIGLPFGLYVLYLARQRPREVLRRYGPMLLGLAPMVLALLAYNYALTGNPLKNPIELWWPFDRLGFGEGIGISGVHTVPDGLWNTYRNLTELLKHLYGWPAYLTLSLALLPFVTLRARRWDWLFAASCGALVMGHVAWWADGVMYGPRYYYEMLGLLALLTAQGVATLSILCRQFVAWWLSSSNRAVSALPYLFVLGLIVYNVAYYLPEQWSLHRGYNYVNGAELQAVRQRNVHNAVVFVDVGKWYEWWNYGAVFPANTPTLDGDVVFAKDRGAAQNKRVMDIYPGRQYYRLSGTAIAELAPER